MRNALSLQRYSNLKMFLLKSLFSFDRIALSSDLSQLAYDMKGHGISIPSYRLCRDGW